MNFVCIENSMIKVVCCSYSPSGQRLLSGSRDGTVKLWDAITGNPIQSFNTQNGVMVSIRYVEYNARLRFLVVASYQMKNNSFMDIMILLKCALLNLVLFSH